MLFDTHCHVDVPPLTSEGAWQDAREAGVLRALAIGVSMDAWDTLAARRATWPGLDIALGLHPQKLDEIDDATTSATLAALSSRAVQLGARAIGECGLDGPMVDKGVPLARQTAVLDAHVEVARALDLPLVLHVLDAHGAALDAMSRHARLARGGVVHGWSGSRELAQRWVELGFSIAIGPSITFLHARRPIETAIALPPHAIVLETDAPYARPASAAKKDADAQRRPGKVSDLRIVAERVAELRGMPFAALAALTTANAERLFGAA